MIDFIVVFLLVINLAHTLFDHTYEYGYSFNNLWFLKVDQTPMFFNERTVWLSQWTPQCWWCIVVEYSSLRAISQPVHHLSELIFLPYWTHLLFGLLSFGASIIWGLFQFLVFLVRSSLIHYFWFLCLHFRFFWSLSLGIFQEVLLFLCNPVWNFNVLLCTMGII